MAALVSLLFMAMLTSVMGLVLCDCRLVAIGDLHGDLENAQRVLQAARILNANNEWIAGCTTLVQTGDIVDRGPQSLQTLDFFHDLQMKAMMVGGDVVMLLGNHELLNFEGATHYVNPVERSANGGASGWQKLFASGGRYRSWMESMEIVASINNTIFVHAGILPSYAALGVTGINRMFHIQLKSGAFGQGILGDDGPLWTRAIIQSSSQGDCSALEMSLQLLGAKRMVVGHTIQNDFNIHSYCDGKLIAIDVAISKAISGQHPGCVEFLDEKRVRPIYAK